MNSDMFKAMFGKEQEEDDHGKPHPLSDEAQRANLEDAWRHYSTPKEFRPGEIVRQRTGLGCIKQSTMFLYIRPLNAADAVDGIRIDDGMRQMHCNKLDCVVAFVDADGHIIFLPADSDTFEKP